MGTRTVDLESMTIGDLISYAESIGVNSPGRFSTRAAVIQLIWKQLSKTKGNQ